jgi:hypothetical protein
VRTSFVLVFCTALASAQTTPAPAALEPPDGQQLTFQAHGVGVQVYSCANKDGSFAWVLKGPDAKLLDRDGKTVGKHYAGPTWQASDGSLVVGKATATVPSPDGESVPWLLLKATKQEGAGVLSGVLSIPRTRTRAPASRTKPTTTSIPRQSRTDRLAAGAGDRCRSQRTRRRSRSKSANLAPG